MKPLDKKMSLGAQKEYKAEARRKHEIQMKIRKAEKNLKTLLEEIKKFTEKADEELIHPELSATCGDAKFADKNGKYFKYLYAVFEGVQTGNISKSAHLNPPNARVGKNNFVAFVKFFCKDLSETQCSDMFMNLTKRLQGMLLGTKPAEEFGDSLSPNRPGNKDLQSIAPKLQYGLTQAEIDDMILDFTILDQIYEKWAQEDDSLSGVLNVKITKSKNADFRLKMDSWKNRKNERK